MKSEETPPSEGQTKMRQKAWAAAGFVAFALGCVGAALPVLPTTPFILVAAFCFARSSKRLNAWFKGTKLYNSVLRDFSKKRTMTLKAKLSILIPVTILLGVSFFLMDGVPIGQAVVAVVWAAHVIYFGFVVKLERSDVQSDAWPNVQSNARPNVRPNVQSSASNPLLEHNCDASDLE